MVWNQFRKLCDATALEFDSLSYRQVVDNAETSLNQMVRRVTAGTDRLWIGRLLF